VGAVARRLAYLGRLACAFALTVLAEEDSGSPPTGASGGTQVAPGWSARGASPRTAGVSYDSPHDKLDQDFRGEESVSGDFGDFGEDI
jgi:hypothetical protein